MNDLLALLVLITIGGTILLAVFAGMVILGILVLLGGVWALICQFCQGWRNEKSRATQVAQPGQSKHTVSNPLERKQ